MKKLVTPLILLTTLLAACGTSQPMTPVQGGTGLTGPNVPVRLTVAGPSSNPLISQGLQPLGTPTGAPLGRILVTVRDSQNNVLYFNNGTYAPLGAQDPNASSVVVLEKVPGGFGNLLLLPKGDYTFENAGKKLNTLFTYGPAEENKATIDGESDLVVLKFHAVLKPNQSRLEYATPMKTLYTNTTFNLNLNARSAEFDGQTYVIPTSDLVMEQPAYTIESASGILRNEGSALGVKVTAVGTVADPNLRVRVHFKAWVRQEGTDTAVLRPVTLPAFESSIQINAVVADTREPELNFAPITTAAPSQSTILTGQAYDNETGVQSVKLYDDNALVASTNPEDWSPSVAAVDITPEGGWTAVWTPVDAGDHDLIVLAADYSGNEGRSSQTVSVGGPPVEGNTDYDALATLSSNQPYVCCTVYTLPANGDFWMKVNASAYPYNSITMEVDAQTGPVSEFTTTYGLTRETATLPMNSYGSYQLVSFQHTSNTYWMHVVNNTNHNVDIRPYVGD